MPKATTPLPDGADVVIIGAGIMGLSVAYNLARQHGVTRVCVLDEGYLCGGASGRNGGGVRAQWSSETNIRLMQESLRLCGEFASEHHINTWFRQGGYLFLARTDQQAERLAESVALQRRQGLATELLEPAATRRVVPELETSGVRAASYNPDDAVVFPWPFVWGYAEGARRLGVAIHPFTRVTGIVAHGRAIQRVETTRGGIQTSVVVNAAGARSPEVARLLGVELPNRPHRHEICSSEPLKPWLEPLVADLSNGLYFSQSTRGEIVGGIGNERVPPGYDQASSVRFLALYARALLNTCPTLASVKVLRQWSGLYDITPDANPIIGAVDDVDGFLQLSGFMGHGFMMAPVIGQHMAEHIARGTTPSWFSAWNLRRFREGKLLDESMIIG